MAITRIKRPRDTFELAKLIGDIATNKVVDKFDDGKNPAAVALGRLGGKKGGKARAEKLNTQQKREIAVKAAKKRWEKD